MIKVLIAEDEAIERKYLTHLIGGLEAQDIFVTASCADGEEAVLEAESCRPDILILDIEMPKLNGLEAAKQIRSRLPDVRILILTAFSEFEYAKMAIRIGVDDYFVKPGSDEQLIEKVSALAEQVKKEKEEQEHLLFVKAQLSQYDKVLIEELITSVIFSRKDAVEYFIDYIGLQRITMKSYFCCIVCQEPEADITEDMVSDIGEIFREGGCRYAGTGQRNEWTFLVYSEELIRQQHFRDQILHRFLNISDGFCRCEVSEVYEDAGMVLEAYRQAKGKIEAGKAQRYEKEPLRAILYRYETVWMDAALSGKVLDCRKEAVIFSQEFQFQKDGLENGKSSVYFLYMLLTRDVMQFFNRELKFERIQDFRERVQVIRNFNMLQQVTSELLEEILRTVREQKARKEDKLVLMVADYLKAHFREALSLNGVAEHFRMSPYHLSKMFPKTMGASFVEYLTSLRVECAKTMLMTGTYSITDVAFSVGYQDSGYFSKVFKKMTGLSPREFSESVSRKK